MRKAQRCEEFTTNQRAGVESTYERSELVTRDRVLVGLSHFALHELSS
jgi:hypothetical protein